jgi:hypothetical protein
VRPPKKIEALAAKRLRRRSPLDPSQATTKFPSRNSASLNLAAYK